MPNENSGGDSGTTHAKDSPQKNKIEIILAKPRNGHPGTIELGFQREYGLSPIWKHNEGQDRRTKTEGLF